MKYLQQKYLSKSIFFIFFASCSSTEYDAFSKMGSSVLSQTGVVSGSQSDALFKFGGKLNESAEEISPEQEYYLGRAVSANILSKFKPLNDQIINKYLTTIATVIANSSDLPQVYSAYRVQVLDTEEINALSAPGGFIFVTKGFLKLVPNEEALAGLIAHEVAHIVKGHGVSAIKKANLTAGLISMGKALTPSEVATISEGLTTTFGESVDDVMTSLLVKGYSRSQEYEADEYAVDLLRKSGYKPSGINEMLENLKAKSKENSEGGWSSTHPDAEDRIDELDSTSDAEAAGVTERNKRFAQIIAKL